MVVAMMTTVTRSTYQSTSHAVQAGGGETEANKDDQGSCQADKEASSCSLVKLRIGLEWFLNPDHLPLLVAQDQGYFLARGLDVELVAPEDHWQAEEEILAGRLDVALTEPLHLAQDAASGKPVLGFARFFHTDGCVMYRTDSGIKRPADLCGQTISYPGSPGPGGPAIVQTMVKTDGKYDCPLDSYGKYNGGFFHTDALEQGHATAATLIFWNFEIPEATARGLPVAFFSLKNWGVPDFCQLVLFTTPERFAALKKASLLRQLVLALRKATGFIHQHPEASKEIYRKHAHAIPDDPIARQVLEATLNATLPAFPNDGMMAMDYYHRLMQWLVDTNQVKADAAAKTTPELYWTNEVAW